MATQEITGKMMHIYICNFVIYVTLFFSYYDIPVRLEMIHSKESSTYTVHKSVLPQLTNQPYHSYTQPCQPDNLAI